MTKREQINLLNSMEIEEISASCGELDYILVADNETNRDILHNLGMTDEEINNCADYGCIEISGLVCDIGAFWFDGEKFYFEGCIYEDRNGILWEVTYDDEGWFLAWHGNLNECIEVKNQPIKNIENMRFWGEVRDCERGIKNDN